MSKIVGVAGLNASGKSTVCDYFKKNGYTVLSLSDAIRWATKHNNNKIQFIPQNACSDELKARKLDETRENLLNTGNDLRNSATNQNNTPNNFHFLPS